MHREIGRASLFTEQRDISELDDPEVVMLRSIEDVAQPLERFTLAGSIISTIRLERWQLCLAREQSIRLWSH